MAYIGNTPANIFTSLETQTITGDGSTEYTLTHAVSSGKDILVYINNVKQEEGSSKSYTATGNTITFSDAVASTDSYYLLYVNRAIATHTPADASVDADAIAGGAVTSAKLANATLVLPNKLDANGNEIILDADADTSITADTDDQIDIRISGADDFQFTANTFTAQSGSSIVVPDGGLTFGSTAITSTGAELNILDGVTATTAELNIMDGVTSTTAELNILDGVTATAAELNIMDGDTSATSTTVADADRVVLNDNGTMKQVAVTDLSAYFDDEITAMPNLTSASGSTIKLAGKETIYVPASAMYPESTNGCSDLTQVELSNGPELKCLDFDASSDEHAQFTVAFPKSWNEGTVTFQAYFTVTGTNTGTVSWALSGVAVSDNDTINASFGTAVAPTAKAHSGTSNDINITAESGNVTIAGSPAEADMVFFRVMRDVSADDQSGDARLLGIKLFFTTNAANDA